MLTGVRYWETRRTAAIDLRKEANCGAIVQQDIRGPDKETELIQATLARDPMFYKDICRARKEAAAAHRTEMTNRMRSMEHELKPLVLAVCKRFDELTLGEKRELPYWSGRTYGLPAVELSANMCKERVFRD